MVGVCLVLHQMKKLLLNLYKQKFPYWHSLKTCLNLLRSMIQDWCIQHNKVPALGPFTQLPDA